MNRTPNLRKRRGERLDEWQAALKRIKDDGQRRNIEETRRAIVAYFEQDKDKGITAEIISLLCPISNKRVIEPARGVDCTHFACFDLPTFLELQSRTPNWDCPFAACKRTLSLDTVVIDEYIGGVLAKVDDLVVKIELLPSGAWKPVEAGHGATSSMEDPDNSEDIQVVLEKLATRNQKEIAERTVSVSVLEQLRRQIGDLLEQFNGLGYKRLGGIAASLADMNIFVKQQIRQAREQAYDACAADRVPSTTAEPVAVQKSAATATQDASSQTSPLETSRDEAVVSITSASTVALATSPRELTQPFKTANADADSHPSHSPTRRGFALHTGTHLPPKQDATPKPKEARDKGVSAWSQTTSVTENIEAVLAILPPEATSSFVEFIAHPDLSTPGKIDMLKEFVVLCAESKIDSDAIRMLLWRQLAQNREERSQYPKESAQRSKQPTEERLSATVDSHKDVPSDQQSIRSRNSEDAPPVRKAVRGSTEHTCSRLTPYWMSASARSLIEELQSVLSRLASDAQSSYVEFVTRPDLSDGGKRELLKALLVHVAEKRLSSDDLRRLLRRQTDREERSRSSSSTGYSRTTTIHSNKYVPPSYQSTHARRSEDALPGRTDIGTHISSTPGRSFNTRPLV